MDLNNNVYLTYKTQNVIEKYDSNGTKLFKMSRHLGIVPGFIERKDIPPGAFYSPDFKLISPGIAIDEKGRIWVVTANREPNKSEKIGQIMTTDHATGGINFRIEPAETDETDMFDIEVFDSDGVFLGKIRMEQFIDSIRIFGNKLLVIDKLRTMQIFVYEING